MRLSNAQKKAIRIALTFGEVLDGNQIGGKTSKSLCSKGLFYRDFEHDGFLYAYKLTEEGDKVAKDLDLSPLQ